MPQDPRPLIKQAFDMARRSGKDGRRMSLAVLKNRMLQLTRKQFQEVDYGATSFLALLQSVPDTVRIDATHPVTIELISIPGGDHEIEAPTLESKRIREDLWRAALDYSSGVRYLWDGVDGVARIAAEGEEGRILPSATREELALWRKEFVEQNANSEFTDDERDRLRRWCDEAQSTYFLPGKLRGPWNGELKRRVRGRLEAWFLAQGLAVPSDLVVSTQPRVSEIVKESVEDLRNLVLRCVRAMTHEELRALSLPPAAVLRARLDRK